MDPRAVIDSLDVGVAAIAPDWTIVEWSAPAARLTGLRTDQVLGRNFWIMFPSARGSRVERVLHEVLLDGEPGAYVAPSPSHEFAGHVLETRVTRGPRNHLVLVFRHLHEQLVLDPPAADLLAAYETERRLYARLFDTLPIPAILVTTDGQILEATLAGTLREAVTRQQRLRLSLDVRGESPRQAEAVVENVEPVEGPAKLLLLAVDVSREVLLQRKLLQADRLSQLGALVSGVAHELNNPLAAIAAFAEVLKVDAKTPDMKEGADRVIALHKSALRKARVQVIAVVEDSVPAVIGDPQELQQVLLKALVNAEQAIAATGRPGKVFITARHVDDQVVLNVEDTGPGIPPELLDRVFEPFFTTKGDAGTGLGLAISYGLVKASGGRMYVHNLEGGGARLGIELPVDPAHVRPATPGGFRPSDRALSVLLVDDEEGVRRGLTRMAERLGHHVASVPSVPDALRQLEAPDARLDALLLDVHLDEEHSGFDLFDALRRDGRGLERRVIFTTGDSMSVKTRDRLEEAARPLLKKPFNLEELREVLDRVAAE